MLDKCTSSTIIAIKPRKKNLINAHKCFPSLPILEGAIFGNMPPFFAIIALLLVIFWVERLLIVGGVCGIIFPLSASPSASTSPSAAATLSATTAAPAASTTASAATSVASAAPSASAGFVRLRGLLAPARVTLLALFKRASDIGRLNHNVIISIPKLIFVDLEAIFFGAPIKNIIHVIEGIWILQVCE